LALVTFSASSQAITTSTTGGALEYPAVQTGTTFSLTIDEYTYVGPTVTQNTRAYNGDIVGPTLRVSPGTTITLTLTNDLQAAGFNTAALHNEFRQISVTNLHTHGLHISGNAPGDSIFTEVAAGASYTYTYVIPANHMGGTFWYHPHHHGSTAIQAGGGACGMIVVEDPPGFLPAELASMEERILVMQHLNMPELTEISQEYETNCQNAGGTAAQCDDTAWAAGPTAGAAANIVLVNGMTQPVISMTANTWYRFRIVYAAVDSVITPWVAGCSIQLLAKDGVYLHSMPRTITATFMGPGSRADWAISCPAGSYTMESAANAGRRLQGKGGGLAGGGAGNAQIAQTLATLTVTGTATATSLSTVSVDRPCYLVDLRSANPSSTTTFDLGPAPQINGNTFATSTTYEASFAVGQVHQLTLQGIDAHPFHLHVNHFQLQANPADTAGDYFLAGDWHDTLLMVDANANARFQSDRYTGSQVIHCHILEHEDEGMMLVTSLTGTEGTLFTAAESIDASCYRNSYVGTPFLPPSPPSSPSPPLLPPAVPVSDNPCFPSSATVALADGSTSRIDALKEGDAILTVTKGGALSTDTLSLLSLADSEEEATFVTLRVDANRSLTLTPEHHLPVGAACCATLRKAKEIVVGQTIWALPATWPLAPEAMTPGSVASSAHMAPEGRPTPRPHTVVGKSLTSGRGLHSPVTTHGTFPIVDGFVTAFDSLEGIALAELGLPYLLPLLKATGTASLARRLLFPAGAYIDGLRT